MTNFRQSRPSDLERKNATHTGEIRTLHEAFKRRLTLGHRFSPTPKVSLSQCVGLSSWKCDRVSASLSMRQVSVAATQLIFQKGVQQMRNIKLILLTIVPALFIFWLPNSAATTKCAHFNQGPTHHFGLNSKRPPQAKKQKNLT